MTTALPATPRLGTSPLKMRPHRRRGRRAASRTEQSARCRNAVPGLGFAASGAGCDFPRRQQRRLNGRRTDARIFAQERKHIGARFFFPSRASANCRASTRAPPASAARSIAAAGPTWPAKSPRVARSWPATGHPAFRRDESVPPPSRALRWRHLRRAL